MRGRSGLGEQGKPASTGFVGFTTANQRRRNRFDYWRELYPSVTLEPADRSNHRAFRGDLVRFVASSNCAFAVSWYDDTLARFDRPNSDYVLFTAGIGGDALAEDERGNRTVSAPDTGLVVIDPTHKVQTRTRNVCQISLIVPRRRFVAAGEALGRNDSGVHVLPERGVTAFLLAQMHMLARQAGTIDAGSADIVLSTMADLAVAALTQTGAGENGLAEGGHENAIVAAARRFIDLHLDEHDLTAERIARAIGCSRAQLFRVFERDGHSIAHIIRQARLAHARHLLATDHGMGIEQVAYRCGYTSAAAFTRAFRLDAGMTPRTFRHEVG